MKRYNRIIVLSIGLYLCFAFLLWYGIRQVGIERDTFYKVEWNRIYNYIVKELQKTDKIKEFPLTSYQWVTAVTYVSLSEMEEEELGAKLYEQKKGWKLEVRPVYQEGKLQGFVRFDYEQSDYGLQELFWYMQFILGGMELLLLSILFYLKYKLLFPFQKLSRMPQELAKGHFGEIVKEEKSKYFGQFLWGLGQLKDTLAISRKRTLELEKEKKLLLLSLSHDIKTPLNNIKLYAKALEEQVYSQDGERKFAYKQIGEKATEIERYVGEIIKNSREDILDIQVEQQEFYLHTLMKKVMQTYEEKCKIRRVQLSVGNYKNRLLKGDLDRMLEVFENIFENAYKYGDGRKIAITFYEEDECQLIRIFNTGIPVTENDFNHIFESFFRAANSEGQEGNGLGLYICREIMQKMGGAIFAEREEQGMAFILVFG